MSLREPRPDPRYLAKLRWSISLIALAVLIGGALFGVLISLDEDISGRGIWVSTLITLGVDLVWWIPAMFWTAPYHRSLHYEVREDEVIVRGGVITQSVKHVPYRTVTNLTVKRGVLDRWLGIGTLEIQTAGRSGSDRAEQSLAGLADVNKVYDIVVASLRRYRGAMAPTESEVEAEASVLEGGAEPEKLLRELLVEVRAIRGALEERS